MSWIVQSKAKQMKRIRTASARTLQGELESLWEKGSWNNGE